MALPAPQLMIDLAGTPFQGTPVWTDCTDSLELGGDGQPISVAWGRQDERSEPTPAACSFTLANLDGSWTPGHAAAPADWNVGVRVRVGVAAGTGYVDLYEETYSGYATVDRFDGYVDSIEPTWPGGVQSWSVVKVSCTDVTARLGRLAPLRTMVEQEMLADSPTCLYPMSEPAESTSAGNISSDMLPAMTRQDSKYGPGTMTFGTDMATFGDARTGVLFDSPNAGESSSNRPPATSMWMQHPEPTAPGGGFTVECWATTPTVQPDSAYYLVQIESATNTMASLRLIPSGGSDAVARFQVSDGTDLAAPTGTANLLGGDLHHFVGVLDDDLVTARLYIDGQLVDTDTVAGSVALPAPEFTSVGGFKRRGEPLVSSSYSGVIALVATYDQALSAARVLDHYQAGMGTLEEPSDERYARVAGYAGVTPASLPAGVAVMGPQMTDGRSVTDVLAEVARTEGTVSFVTASGDPTFQARTARYNASPGLTVTSDDLSADTTVRVDRQGQMNQLTVDRPGGATQRYVNEAAQAADGILDGGSFTVAPSTDDDALQNAAWQVELHTDPQVRIPSAKMDLREMDEADAQAVLTATISTLLEILDLPSQAPTTSPALFVEGGKEDISPAGWTVEFFTSPDLPPVLVLDDATLGELDAANLIAF